MKTEMEIKAQLDECKSAVAEYEKLAEETNTDQPDLLIHQGWVEALEFVLDTIKVPENVQQAINTIADLFLQINFYKNINGAFAHAKSIEYVDEIYRFNIKQPELDEYTVETGWEALVVFGCQDESHSDSYEEWVWVTQLDIDEWVAGKAEKWYPRFQQDQFDGDIE